MKWNQLWLSCACALAMAGPALAAAACQCVPGKPTAESYDWNFHREANQLIQQIQDQSVAASRYATKLQSYQYSPDMSWQSHAAELSYLKSKINDMSQDLCRLETIRSSVTPWQRRTIQRISKDIVLMANNTEDAIHYVTSHQRYLWNPTYRNYTDNLANLSQNLQKTTDRAVEFANVRTKNRELRHEIEMNSSS